MPACACAHADGAKRRHRVGAFQDVVGSSQNADAVLEEGRDEGGFIVVLESSARGLDEADGVDDLAEGLRVRLWRELGCVID